MWTKGIQGNSKKFKAYNHICTYLLERHRLKNNENLGGILGNNEDTMAFRKEINNENSRAFEEITKTTRYWS